jgi:type IV pilus assembly protein PilE
MIARTASIAKSPQQGFSLIELIVAIAIVGILTSLAVPSYLDSMRRGYVEEATALLVSGRIAVEQYYLDNRTYVGVPCPVGSSRFAITCTTTASTYTLTATGSGSVESFVYKINERDARSTAGGWGTGTCWILRHGDDCP